MEYWIVFTPGEGLFARFLKKGFRHLYVITQDDYTALKIDACYDIADFKMSSIQHKDLAIASFRDEYVIHIKMKGNPSKKYYFPIRLVTCVSIVKYILGIHVWSLTPYQLYKRLLKMSAKDMPSHFESVKLLKMPRRAGYGTSQRKRTAKAT